MLMQLGWPIFLTFVRIFANSGRNFAVGRLCYRGGGVVFYWVLRQLPDKCRCVERPTKHNVVVMYLFPFACPVLFFGLTFSFCFGFFAPTLEHITAKVMRPERGSKI